MGKYSILKEIEREIRASQTYYHWVKRNLGPACAECGSTEELQVHHMVDLYHEIYGPYRYYGDKESTKAHVLARHADDLCEGVTLCKKCHESQHPGKSPYKPKKKVRMEDWITIPRKLPWPFLHHSKTASHHGLSLFTAQLLAGMGWYILNGKMDSKIIEFRRSQMMSLLGKKKGSSFNKSLARGLNNLEDIDVITGHHTYGPNVEIHLSQSYLDLLASNPWFLSVPDIHAKSMPVLALKWFLSYQGKQTRYKIGKDKLVANLDLRTSYMSFVERCVKKACSEIEWAEYKGNDGEFMLFQLSRRGAVPIFSLRESLLDSISEGV